MPEVNEMTRRYGFMLLAILALAAVLVACGGEGTPTDTPRPPTPTTAPPTATPTTPPPTATPTTPPPTATPTTAPPTATPTTAPATATATRAAGSVTTGTTTAGSPTTGTTTAGAGLTTYTDPQNRFSFSRPSAWVQQSASGQDIVVQFNGTNPILSVNIVVTPLPGSLTPDQYLPLVLDQLKQTIPDVAVSGSTPVQVGGEAGIQVDYTGTVSNNKLSFSQIFVAHKGNAYVLTLVSQQADMDKAKQQAVVVIQTWKFLS